LEQICPLVTVASEVSILLYYQGLGKLWVRIPPEAIFFFDTQKTFIAQWLLDGASGKSVTISMQRELVPYVYIYEFNGDWKVDLSSDNLIMHSIIFILSTI
jgi:hypothetical protein